MRNFSFTHRRPSQGSRARRLVAAVMLMGSFVFAQAPSGEQDGKVFGGYKVNQTVEIGGHIADVKGNEGVYRTFVNVQSGPRLLDYSLNMRSLTRESFVFDDLYFNNAGYGGDPQSFSRLRVSKNRFYNLTATYRRDVNYFNYNMLGNPFNYGPTVTAPTATTIAQYNDAIHTMNTRRRMGDFSLTIAPQSAVRLRLGYSRNLQEGPSWSSYHEGTDIQLFQDFSNRQDQYQIGVDFRVLPRTTFSYDQFFTHNRVDSSWTDPNVNNGFFINTPGGQRPFDIGAIYYPYYNQPCTGVSVSPTGVVTQRVTATQSANGCQGYASYLRTSPTETNIPTEQFSFQSNYWHRLEMNGNVTYSSAKSTVDDFYENVNAWVSRTDEIGYRFTGPASVRRISASADFGLTYHLAEQWSLSNQTRWINWRIPGTWASSEIACFPGVAPNDPSFAGPYTPPSNAVAQCAQITGTPATAGPSLGLSANSPADILNEDWVRFLGEKSISNQTALGWEPSERVGLHLGYRFERRNLTWRGGEGGAATYFGAPVATRPGNGTVVTTELEIEEAKQELNEHVLLFGVVGRPIPEWRINADFEWGYRDNVFVPTAARNFQVAKIRSSYRMADWGSISGTINLKEGRNSVIPTNPDGSTAFPDAYASPRHQDHNRTYGVNLNLTPSKWFGLDLGYTYNNLFSTSGTCLMAPAGIVPEGGAIQRCWSVGHPFVPGTPGSAIPAVLDYAQTTHDGYFNLRLTPIPRVAFNIGYDVVSDNGRNDWLRGDTLAVLRYPVDQVGNVIQTATPAAGQIFSGYAAGPNPLVPLGPLAINWHRPSGSVEVELTRTLMFKGAYNHYGYNEKSAPGPVAARDARANVGTLSLKYAF